MITEETYQKMKELVAEYEAKPTNKLNKPYISDYEVVTIRKYNPHYGDNRECECGHDYHRHFDSYENMEVVGCKYCGCGEFVEKE